MASLTLEEGKFLVKLARRAVEEYLKRGIQIKPPSDVPEKLKEKRGVFVTINRIIMIGGERTKRLRGCIGFPLPVMPLVEATIEAAISAATSDPRFKPMELQELSSVTFEVSVLTVPELIRVLHPKEYPSKIRIGVDGLIVERGLFKGLLLPQVAVEWNWTPEEFLSNCCIKAGLMPDAWLDEETRVYKFQAEIFEELEPEGEVIKKELHWHSA
ncbi:MAG: TIGR00296 family protein [Candidatus Methanomethylicota archaeon]|uniref:Protein DRJ26_01875 n=1 Tax=Thermoproteota archaeon TaxID=2056631 RepID=A0A497F673_9CREN|nr:MAG: TIGR00296 family protein [Candidatus Verstraetearchaeota archaeon]